MNAPDLNTASEPPALRTADLQKIGERLRAASAPRYWRSLDEAALTREFVDFLHREFPEHASEWSRGLRRRHFLQLMGASLGLAGLTACTRQPLERIVPYVKQPEELIPGKPLFFATAMTLGGYATGLLVESHEGHPTKIEGNPEHPMSLGATNPFHQASLLDLYDPDRSKAVTCEGTISTWEKFISVLHDLLSVQQNNQGAGLRILTETVTSPTAQAQLQAVLQKFPRARWHQFEPLHSDNTLEGARLALGEPLAPQYYFDRAAVVLSLESDFLYTHPAALRYTRDFANRRRVSGGRTDMNRLYVIESTPTLTGANADHRLPSRSGDIESLARAVAEQLSTIRDELNRPLTEVQTRWTSAAVQDLKANRGSGLVIAGECQPPIVHALAHTMNQMLGNVNSTVSYTASAEAQPIHQLESLRELIEDLQKGRVEILLVLGGNPVFNSPADFDFATHLKKARVRIHLSGDFNETSAACQWHIPQNHYLESWSDARAYDGTVSIVQPLILPLYAGKSIHELLDAMIRLPARSDYEIVRDYWESQHNWPDFEKGWRRALHDGWIANSKSPVRDVPLRSLQLSRLQPSPPQIEINFRPDPTIFDGRFANNAWLQELPKPLSQLTWDNPVSISPALARKQALRNGDMVKLKFRDRVLSVPVWISPGQADDTVALTLGYGRRLGGQIATNKGFNSFALRASPALWFGEGATLAKAGRQYPLATSQTHHAIDAEQRQIIRETTLAAFVEDPDCIQEHTEKPAADETLFHPREHDYDGCHWGMSIDLNACVGCGACIVACQAENNIPVVGKTEVLKHREMQWLRVDAYFSGGLENPETTHQPVPCMHCENAPCELVCPVAATVHDHEGLNLQVYNRCIGTRYCSNNCPYKVRRFNFFHYADDTPGFDSMHNPNVSVRSRGVMEKCTYCIQRISAARIQSKLEDRKIRDLEIRTACQQACPAEAIVFGDLNDPASRVVQLKKHSLNFAMLGELNTRPRTTYLAKLRNPSPALTKTAATAGGSHE
jgi:molybdopterin-containing oxidoreductase family iron-sulfur binding subunit